MTATEPCPICCDWCRHSTIDGHADTCPRVWSPARKPLVTKLQERAIQARTLGNPKLAAILEVEVDSLLKREGASNV